MKKYYEVLTFITSMNFGQLIGKTSFSTEFLAEEFAANFESLRPDALAFVTVAEEEE